MENNIKIRNVSEMNLDEVQQEITTINQYFKQLKARENILISVEGIKNTRSKAESLIGKCLSHNDGLCLVKLCAINEVGNNWARYRVIEVDAYDGNVGIRTNVDMYISIDEYFDSNYMVIDNSKFMSEYEKIKALCDKYVGVG